MRKGPFIAAIMLVMISLSFPLFGTGDVDGVGAPAVKIELDHYKQSVDVEPDEDYDGIVIFTGNVTVLVPWNPSFQYLIVYLNASAGNGTDYWPTSTSSALTFSKEVTTQPFMVVVRVPPSTTQYPTGTLEISGRWRYSPGTLGGSIEPVTARIDIIGYYDHSLRPLDSYEECYRSDEVDYEVVLSNEGNAYDSYSLSIENSYELNKKGVYVTVSDAEVPPFTDLVVNLIMTTSSSATRGNFDIELLSQAQNASLAGDPDVERTLTFRLRVLSGERPSDEPEPQTGPEPDGPVVPDDDKGTNGDDDGKEGNEAINKEGDDNISPPFVGFVIVLFLIILVIVVGFIAYIFGRRED